MMSVTFYYLTWHYSSGLRDFFRVWTNFIWFFWNLFSIGLLTKTLFAPFHRLHEDPRPGFHPDELFESLIVNILMRLVGFVVRIILIIMGTAAILATVLAGVVMFFVWFFAPLVIPAFIAIGLLFVIA